MNIFGKRVNFNLKFAFKVKVLEIVIVHRSSKDREDLRRNTLQG